MKIIVCNQKKYLNKTNVDKFINDSKNLKTKHKLIICPASTYLKKFKDYPHDLGSQNMSLSTFSTEPTVKTLIKNNVTYSLVGHSYRRKIYGESIKDTNYKIIKLMQHGIIPILCVGEEANERLNNSYKQVIKSQVMGALNTLSTTAVEKIIIAYEPIWSIGTNVIPENEEIQEVVRYIKKIVKDNYNCIPNVLYGGSINEINITTLKKIKYLDGYLIGKSSTDVNKLEKILLNCN